MAIRYVKLNQLRVAYPGTSELELSQFLTRDFLKEGWMFKTGPRASDAYKWRWFTLDDRKLMYLEDPLVSIHFAFSFSPSLSLSHTQTIIACKNIILTT